MTLQRLKRDNRLSLERDMVEPVEEVQLVVRPEEAGARLDRFLASTLPWRSRSQVARMIRERRVLVGSQGVRAARRLRAGERVVVRLPDPPASIEPVALSVLHEDEALLVLDKPAGVICHPVGRHRYDTLMNSLQARYRRHGQGELDVVPRLCHRIDRETSGVLVVAKDAVVHADVQQQFEHRLVRKAYLAIVRGTLEGELDIAAPLGLAGHAIRMKMGVRPDGHAARTLVRALRRLRGHTLVEAVPLTGRQHQIRAHLEAVGHPIACDPIYGRPGATEPGEEPLVVDAEVVLRRLALHAYYLCIRHPSRGRAELHIVAPLAPDLASAVARLA
ncbi:MAG: RluA family pseudouridine synthase [Planctomycetes bacterium]|nr:RluA family pseudouridine synthase [Planctomycetota bacterium]